MCHVLDAGESRHHGVDRWHLQGRRRMLRQHRWGQMGGRCAWNVWVQHKRAAQRADLGLAIAAFIAKIVWSLCCLLVPLCMLQATVLERGPVHSVGVMRVNLP